MPRKGQGAKAPAAPYNTGDNEKIDPPAGRAYGARAETETALSLVPAAGSSTPQAPGGPAAGAPPEQPPADVGAMLAAATGYNPDPVNFTGPTANPGEPVTAGLASGPGAGPGTLALPDPQQLDMRTWMSYLPTLEYLASLPGSTASTRNFVRRLRSAIPPSTQR